MNIPEEIQEWPINRLKPYEANARVHSPDQVSKLAASIQTYGWTIPVLATSDGEIIAGHGRVLAAREAGIMIIPVLVADHLTEDQRKAYRLADNRLTEMSDWSETILAEEITLLARENVDIESLGFKRAEIDAIIKENTPEEPRPIPEPPDKPVVKAGELWHLGEHRLLIGEPTEENVKRLMGDERADLFATAPRGSQAAGDYIRIALEHALGENPAIYVWHNDQNRKEVEEAWGDNGIFKHQTIIWDKGKGDKTGNDYDMQHESCLYGWVKGNRPFIASHQVDNGTVWTIAPDEDKPPELFAIPMRKHVKRGGICFEPYAHNGAQIVAGEDNGRRVYALVARTDWAEQIIARWEGINGEMAEREDGKEIGQLR